MHYFSKNFQANTQEGHNEWSRLLTNRLGFSYTEFRDPLTKDKICGAFYHQSLLSSSRIINNHLYEPSPQEALLYELEVSMHNFIVILNDLLHLALFDIHNEQFIKASFFSEDFVDRYFLRLNKLLGHIVDQEQLFEDYNLYGREINLVAPQFIVSLYPQTHIKIRAREKNSNSCEELCADDTMLYKLLYLGINKKSLWEKLIKIDTEEATSTLIYTEISRAYYHSSIDQGLTDDEVKELLGKKYLDYQKNNHSSLFSTLYKKIAIGSEEKFFRELCQNSHADFFSSLYSKEKIINLIQKPLNENLDTGLMITAVSGNKEIAQKILETINKHDVLKKVLTQHNRECSSVLLTAVKFNNSFLVEKIFELIKNDPDLLKTILTQQTRNGLTVLMLAARLGHLKILLTILHTLKEQPTLFLLEEVVTQQEQQGAHALIEATRSDSPRIVQALLESIKDYPALLKKVMILQDKELNNAFIGSSPEIMKIAIDATHAHPEILKNILTQQNNDGDTVLIKAARLGHTAVVEQLLNCVKQYPDILNYLLIQKEKYGRTALDEAISWQRKAVIELLSKNYSNGQKDEEPSITEQLVRLSVNNS